MSDAVADTPATSEAPKIGDVWGDDIFDVRQQELDAILAAWNAKTDHGEHKGPFDGVKLTGADVFYLAACAIIGTRPIGSTESIANVGTGLAALRNPQLSVFVDLSSLWLDRANLSQANLVNALLTGASLDGANLTSAQLKGVNFGFARLMNAVLNKADLTGANLLGANLTGATLFDAQLTAASLFGTQLTSAYLQRVCLTGADLRYANLNRETRLDDANLVGVSLDQITLENTNLAVVLWEGVAPLGDEKSAHTGTYVDPRRPGEAHTREHSIKSYEAAVRANRLLATELRRQGLAEDADVFAYHAQLMQRGLRFQRRQFGRWLVSWSLALLSGYDYRLGRIFAAYAIVVLTFAALFLLPTFLNGTIPTIQNAADALQISLNAIHGRVFFVQFGLDTLQSWLATAESVIGIVIEGVFVAMIIQRLFR